jgi:hypothetical protein
MPSNTPRKRQNMANQSSITSFFTAACSSSLSSTSVAPNLPPEVQSGLISVGMRVRKSVLEGYKSGTYAFKHLPSVWTPLLATPATTSGIPFGGTFSSQGSNTSSVTKKRTYDDMESSTVFKKSSPPLPLPQPPTSITTWARAVKNPTRRRVSNLKNQKAIKRGFHQAIPRKEDVDIMGMAEDFGDAGFLQSVDKMEE